MSFVSALGLGVERGRTISDGMRGSDEMGNSDGKRSGGGQIALRGGVQRRRPGRLTFDDIGRGTERRSIEDRSVVRSETIRAGQRFNCKRGIETQEKKERTRKDKESRQMNLASKTDHPRTRRRGG